MSWIIMYYSVMLNETLDNNNSSNNNSYLAIEIWT